MVAAIIQTQNVGVVQFGDRSGKEALLVWCQRHLQSLALKPPIEVSNFSSSFANGVAFCGIVASLEPGSIDMTNVVKNDAATNLALAFEMAESKLGVPRLLDAADFGANGVDEKSVLT